MMFDSIWSIVEFLSRWKSIYSNPATVLSTQFIWYSKSFVVILTIVRASLSGVDAISNFAHSQEATLRPLKFYDEIIASKLHFQVPLLILVLFLFIPHLKLLSSLKFWSPQRHPGRLESTSYKLLFMLTFWHLLMNHEYS